jgi:hypothetical protein
VLLRVKGGEAHEEGGKEKGDSQEGWRVGKVKA